MPNFYKTSRKLQNCISYSLIEFCTEVALCHDWFRSYVSLFSDRNASSCTLPALCDKKQSISLFSHHTPVKKVLFRHPHSKYTMYCTWVWRKSFIFKEKCRFHKSRNMHVSLETQSVCPISPGDDRQWTENWPLAANIVTDARSKFQAVVFKTDVWIVHLCFQCYFTFLCVPLIF